MEGVVESVMSILMLMIRRQGGFVKSQIHHGSHRRLVTRLYLSTIVGNRGCC